MFSACLEILQPLTQNTKDHAPYKTVKTGEKTNIRFRFSLVTKNDIYFQSGGTLLLSTHCNMPEWSSNPQKSYAVKIKTVLEKTLQIKYIYLDPRIHPAGLRKEP